jgi:hypothetical protein
LLLQGSPRQSREDIAEARRLLAYAYDKEEVRAIKSSKAVGFEPRSPDTEPSLQRTAQGYLKDGFICSDSDLKLSSEDNDSASVYLASDVDSVEDDSEETARQAIVAKFRAKYPEFTVSSEEPVAKVVYKRRVG